MAGTALTCDLRMLFQIQLGGEDAGSKRERAAKRGDAVSQSKRSRAATARD
jgi:hypothetical protein